MDWNEGYRTDVVYTHGYYGEMNPTAMRFSLLMAGYAPPEMKNACEPGYGQGVSLNIHAAAENIAWYGTDFNPVQAGFAQEMAQVSGARAHCYADSFHDFCDRSDLPEFDYIALHGIWSWISADNRAALARLIDKKLRVGGVLYISYNTYPGWAAFRPACDLMKMFVDRMQGPALSSLAKIKDAFAFIERLMEAEPAYLRANPSVTKRLEAFKDKDQHYLVHEFINDIWEPTNFEDMAEILGEARMTFACSANPIQLIPGLALNEKQRQLVQGLSDPVLRETALDFIFNTQFRKDYWIKGPRPLSNPARAGWLRNEQVVLTAPVDKLKTEIKTGMGDVNLSEATLHILSQVLGDGKVHTLSELEKAAQEAVQRQTGPEGVEKENLLTLAQAVCVLMAGGLAGIAQAKQDSIKARPCCEKLNLFIENMAISGSEISFLASPVTGGGISVSRFDMLFLLALRRGAKAAAGLAAFARDCLNLAGQRILKDGQAITDQAETLEYLQKQAEAFLQERLALLKNLQIA